MTLEQFLEFLKNSKNYRDRDERRKTLKKYLSSPELYRCIFIPENTPNIPEDLGKMMEYLSKKRMVKDIRSIIHDEDYEKFQGSYRSSSEERFKAFRSFVALVYSVSNVAASAVKDDGNRYNEMVKNNAMKRDLRELRDHIEEYSQAIEDLGIALHKLVKKEAKHLSQKTGLPRDLCEHAICSTPGYINKNQISNYLSIMLSIIYSYVNENGDFVDRGKFRRYNKFNDIDWGNFFGYLYGKENLPDIAIYITLEGVNRIDQYHSDEVRDCWDSLTFFALDTLEKSPMTIKESMMDTYLQVISTMFANGSNDLRVNLLTLDNGEYPTLVKMIDKYAGKIKDVIDQYK